MPSTFFGLDIGTSGLHTYQAAINTTAHNITNARTKGYSRQVVNRVAKDPISIGERYGMVGTGVIANKISQIRDEYYDVKFRTANTVGGRYETRGYYLKEVQNYLNEIKDGGFNKNITDFFADLSEVEKDPTSLSARAKLVNQGYSLTEFFNNTAENLKKSQDEINFNIKNTVDKINNYGDQIATLTKQINVIEVNGGFANDLRDQRNNVVDELSKLANISVREESIGRTTEEKLSGVSSYTVKINGRYLVNNYTSNRIEILPREYKSNINDVEGLYDLAWSDGQNFDIYNTRLGGELAALIDMRDGNNNAGLLGVATIQKGDTSITIKNSNINSVETMNYPPEGKVRVGNQEYEYTSFDIKIEKNEDGSDNFIHTFNLKEGLEVVSDLEEVRAGIGEQLSFKGIPYYMDKLNHFVRRFSKEFNKIHRTGEDLNGNSGIDFFNGIDVIEGTNYEKLDDLVREDDEEVTFSSKDATYYKLTAHNYTVTRKFREEPSLVAVASTIANGVENTDVIKKLENLQKDRSLFDAGKPEEFYQSLISDIGVDTKTAILFSENQERIVKTINNQRISIAGVDSDEESIDLVKFKNCYDLSAKVITVMNEIYNKLINEMAV